MIQTLRRLLSVLAILCGPAAASADAFPQPPSIKGLQVQMVDDALALGIHHAGINVNVTALADIGGKGGGPERTVRGRTFRFSESYLKSLDGQIRPLSDKGVVVYVILIAYPSKDAVRDALVIHPGARKDHQYSVGAFNAETEEGKAWLEAAADVMAERWSGAGAAAHGRVWGWIVGNEVNSHWLWYNMGKAPMADVVAAYERAFRIVAQAVLGRNPAARLYIPFDHHWSVGMHGISKEEAAPGRDFLDAFAASVRERGDLDWHVAAHPYPEDLGNPRVWADRTITFDDSTNKVTFRNLEVLCRHLDKPELRRDGKARRVILSEQGFQTLLTPDGERLQAAAFAYAWEKCRRLPLVDAFIYHRHVDHAHEGGLRLGLWRNAPHSVADPHSRKELWELFRKAGTPEWDAAAAALLPATGLKSWDDLTKP